MPLFWSTMSERYVTAVHLEDPGAADPAATRERLRDRFPRGSTRRMTELGLLVGSVLLELEPDESDALIYASGYGETRALEAYLESFPTPSPTLFQTSIHPSAVQQTLIAQQRKIRTFLPMTGRSHLIAQALTAALLAPERRVLLCGGEERGTWLREQRAASDRSFAFAFDLVTNADAAVAQVRLQPAAPDTERGCGSPLADFFQQLRGRRDFSLLTPGGEEIRWRWL